MFDLRAAFRDVIAVRLDPPRESQPDRTALIWASVVVAILSTWVAQASKGFLEADGVTHYLYARYAFDTPAYMADVWARPMRMLLHAVPAHYFGLGGVRAASLVAALATAWLTYAIARAMNWRLAGLAGMFVLVQPLFFLHSASELTEIPFALLAALAMLALVRRWWWLFALACGLTPGARPEGAAFIALAVVVLSLHRRWLWLPLVFVPIVFWNHMGWYLSGGVGPWHRWLIDHFPYSAQSAYAPGPLYRYLAVLPTVVSPLLVPAVIIGTFGLRQLRGTSRTQGTPLGRSIFVPDEWLIAIIPWGVLIIHSLLHFFGKMSSSGEPRYILATAPFWSLLACRGWVMMADRFEWRHPIRIAVAAALVPVVVHFTYKVVPLREQPDALLCREIATWYRGSDLHERYPLVYGTHPLVYYYLDAPIRPGGFDLIEHPPAGAMYVYDSLYGVWNADRGRVFTPELFEANGWVRAPGSEGFGLPGQTWRVYLSPKPTAASSPSPGTPGEGRGEGS